MLTMPHPLQASMTLAGYKVTAPRRAVLQSVARMRAPLTVHEILARSKRTYPRLGLSPYIEHSRSCERSGMCGGFTWNPGATPTPQHFPPTGTT
jgi:hypothetical protein